MSIDIQKVAKQYTTVDHCIDSPKRDKTNNTLTALDYCIDSPKTYWTDETGILTSVLIVLQKVCNSTLVSTSVSIVPQKVGLAIH